MVDEDSQAERSTLDISIRWGEQVAVVRWRMVDRETAVEKVQLC